MRATKKLRNKKPDVFVEIRKLGVLFEHTDHKVYLIAEQCGDIKKDIGELKFDVHEIKETLDSHTKILDSHTKTLDSHTKILDLHTKTLDSHTEMIGGLTMDMGIVKENIEFMKNSLKRKVDVEEFTALERRVAFLEKKSPRTS